MKWFFALAFTMTQSWAGVISVPSLSLEHLKMVKMTDSSKLYVRNLMLQKKITGTMDVYFSCRHINPTEVDCIPVFMGSSQPVVLEQK